MIYPSEMKQIVITILGDINPSNQSPSILPGTVPACTEAVFLLQQPGFDSTPGPIAAYPPPLPPLFFPLFRPVATTLLFYWLPGGLLLCQASTSACTCGLCSLHSQRGNICIDHSCVLLSMLYRD